MGKWQRISILFGLRSIQRQHHSSGGSGGDSWRQTRLCCGTAVPVIGTDLARGFGSHWKQSWLGILLIKHMLESLGQKKLLRAMCDTCQSWSWECFPPSEGRKKGIQEEQWICGSASRQSVGSSSLQWPEAQGMAVTDTSLATQAP